MQLIKAAEITTPDERQAEKYREKYPIYGELYSALKTSFQKMK